MSEETKTPPDYKNWYHGDLVAELEKRDDRLSSAHATITRLTEDLRIMKSQYEEERDAHLGMITARDIAKKARDKALARVEETKAERDDVAGSYEEANKAYLEESAISNGLRSLLSRIRQPLCEARPKVTEEGSIEDVRDCAIVELLNEIDAAMTQA